MLISRTWLQSYFETELPSAEDIAQTLLLHAFEIEGIEHKDGDAIIDIDVLPNRAHDCLCHEGVAHELSGLLKLDKQTERYPLKTDLDQEAASISVDNKEKCRRYAAFAVNDVAVGESPAWLKERMTSLGQKSINNVVDITNYVMFDCGQPLHAFDADKVVRGITVRDAKEGETMTTLTGEELSLSPDDLVIADDEGVLALAGVKGGTKAQVTADTKNIIVEIANFDPLSTRTTSRRVKIQTDSSKRFENEITSELVPYAAGAVQKLIAELMPQARISGLSDVYHKQPDSVVLELDVQRVQSVLGLAITKQEIIDLFDRFDIRTDASEDGLTVTVPNRRLDLCIQEDLIEEVGRWYGYHNIPSASVSDIHFEPRVDVLTLVINNIKNILVDLGYSETLTYAFVNKGDVSVYNPIASDKQYLRTNISKQLDTARELNLKNAAYFADDRIMMFEIGRVYNKGGEETLCTISCANVNKKAKKAFGTEQEQLTAVHQMLQEKLSVSFDIQSSDNSITFSVDELSGQISSDSYADVFSLTSYQEDNSFSPISVYPYSGRDISLWVDEGVSAKEVQSIIQEKAGPFLKKLYLFDEFSKERRTSYAFSLIFQSDERTLEDADVDGAMSEVNAALQGKGWEVR